MQSLWAIGVIRKWKTRCWRLGEHKDGFLPCQLKAEESRMKRKKSRIQFYLLWLQQLYSFFSFIVSSLFNLHSFPSPCGVLGVKHWAGVWRSTNMTYIIVSVPLRGVRCKTGEYEWLAFLFPSPCGVLGVKHLHFWDLHSKAFNRVDLHRSFTSSISLLNSQ